MKKDDFIRDKIGRKEPFCVPEHYFEDFAQRLMDELPDRSKRQESPEVRVIMPRWRLWFATAAAVCSLAAGGVWFYQHRYTSSERAAATMVRTASASYSSADRESVYIEEMLDYALVENSEIAMYLTGSN